MPAAFKTLPDTTVDQIMIANANWPAFKLAHKNAINTTIGVVIDPSTNMPWRPEAVIRAQDKAIVEINRQHNFGYQTQVGHTEFLAAAGRMGLGDALYDQEADKLLSYQTLGGTGALYLANEILKAILKQNRKDELSLVLDNGWPNHPAIFTRPFQISSYPHINKVTGLYNHQAALRSIANAPDGSVVLLQTCGYNDDGADRSKNQWDEILSLAVSKHDIVLLDSAYLGLADGLAGDRYPIEQSIQKGLLTIVCISFSKNMGLYNERLGGLLIANSDTYFNKLQRKNLHQLIMRLVRRSISSAPLLSAQAATLALKDPNFTRELEEMRVRIVKNRQIFSQYLKNAPLVSTGRGLFTKLYLDGFSLSQQKLLAGEGVHILPNSRINLGGVSSDQVDRLGEIIGRITGL